jgi:predicted HAD superfamily Cof-like phosphohydrolase
MSVQDMVREFHEVLDLPRSDTPTLTTYDERRSREVLLRSEVAEYRMANSESDLAAIMRELGDIVYVAYGSAVSHGVDLDAVIAEIHRANMAKAEVCAPCGGKGMHPPVEGLGAMPCSACGTKGRIVRTDEVGRVVKPEGWRPPDVPRVLGLGDA